MPADRRRIAALQAEKRALQQDLRSAPPSEKRLIIQLIRRCDVDIRQANTELTSCRAQNPAPRTADIRLHLSSCLDPLKRARVEEAVTEAFADQDGVAHSACVDGLESLGVWIPAVGARRPADDWPWSSCHPESRTRASGLSLGESSSSARCAATGRPGPRLDDQGEPNTAGPIFLTNLTYRMEEPSRVVTTVEGFRRSGGLLGDIEFTATVTDDLGVGGSPPISSSAATTCTSR